MNTQIQIKIKDTQGVSVAEIQKALQFVVDQLGAQAVTALPSIYKDNQAFIDVKIDKHLAKRDGKKGPSAMKQAKAIIGFAKK